MEAILFFFLLLLVIKFRRKFDDDRTNSDKLDSDETLFILDHFIDKHDR